MRRRLNEDSHINTLIFLAVGDPERCTSSLPVDEEDE